MKRLLIGILIAGISLPALAAPKLPPVPGKAFPSSVPISLVGIFGCASGIIGAAIIANARENRELTSQEAWSCGIRYFVPGLPSFPG